MTLKKAREYRKLINSEEYMNKAIDCIADQIADIWIKEKYRQPTDNRVKCSVFDSDCN